MFKINFASIMVSLVVIGSIFGAGIVFACSEDDTNALFIERKSGEFDQVIAIDLDRNYLAVVHVEEIDVDDNGPSWRSYPIETTRIWYSDSKGKLYRMKLDPDHMMVRTDHGDTLPMPIRIQVKMTE